MTMETPQLNIFARRTPFPVAILSVGRGLQVLAILEDDAQRWQENWSGMTPDVGIIDRYIGIWFLSMICDG